MTSSKKQIIPVLDMFRLVAALLVVLVHYEIIFGQFVIYGSFSTTALSWFFVLSGFIINYNYTTLTSKSEFYRYYVHRVIRIYPVYFLSVTVSALFITLGYNYLGEGFFGEIRRPYEISYDLPQQKDNAFFLMAAIRHLTFTQSVSAIETLKLLFNGPLWSLVLEIYFYITFPVFLILLRHVNTLQRIVAAFIVGYALQFALIQFFLPDAPQYDVMNLNVSVYTNPVIRAVEFVFGMLLYRAVTLLPAKSADDKPDLLPVAISSIAYVVANVIGEMYVPYQYSMFFVVVPFVTLSVFTLARSNWRPTGSVYKFCLWCGGMSYVLYCFHWPLMEMMQFWNVLPDSLPFPVHLALVVSLLLLVCHVIYKFVETPIRKQLYKMLDKPKPL